MKSLLCSSDVNQTERTIQIFRGTLVIFLLCCETNGIYGRVTVQCSVKFPSPKNYKMGRKIQKWNML
jgi:hypothetical protein